MFSRAEDSKIFEYLEDVQYIDNNMLTDESTYLFDKQASGFDFLFNEKMDLSKYPTNDIWHYKNGNIIRVTKSLTQEA